MTIAHLPRCDYCNYAQTEPGAIVLSPPDGRGYVRKYHCCTDCWPAIDAAECLGAVAYQYERRWASVRGAVTHLFHPGPGVGDTALCGAVLHPDSFGIAVLQGDPECRRCARSEARP